MRCLGPNEAMDLVEGVLDAATMAEIDAHVAGCDGCRRLLAAAVRGPRRSGQEVAETILASTADPGATEEPHALARGAVVDRYVVLERTGRGGMGEVFKAYDPQLDRAVAIKLVRAGRGGRTGLARERLIREARALARVAHPNVVAVFDAGAFGDDEVFIAMEFVTGATLRQWVAEAHPSWRDIAAAYAAAGRGLAAAHAAGLVHRDFKPDNAIRGADGRVRILDFGLARGGGGGDSDAGGEASSSESGSLTNTGVVVGTPAYMPPEQRRGEPVDGRSDQYSFCLSLWEALCGQRPPLDADGRLVGDGGAPREVPAWLPRLLRRGLAVRPDQRFASMDELVVALGRDPGARRRRAALAALALAAAAAAIVLWWPAPPRVAEAPCPSSDQPLPGVWDAPAQAELAAAFRTNGAADAARRVAATLDRYAAAWTAMRSEACEASRVRGEQSPALFDLRMMCLARRRAELGALVGLLRAPDAALVEAAPAAALRLTPVASCADVGALTAPVPPPEDPEARARVIGLQSGLATSRALRLAGRYPEGLATASAIDTAARALGYAPLAAEAAFQLGYLYQATGDYASAEQQLADSAFTAMTGRHFEQAARSAIELIYLLSMEASRHGEAALWDRFAAAAIIARGGNRDLEALLEVARGDLRLEQEDFAAALAHFERALAAEEVLFGPGTYQTATSLANLGMAAQGVGDLPRAADAIERSIAIVIRELGPGHPFLAIPYDWLATIRREQDQPVEAEAAAQRSIEVATAAFGADSELALAGWLGLGRARLRRGEVAEAIAILAPLPARFERLAGGPSSAQAEAELALGQAQELRGRDGDALAAFERSRAAAVTSGGAGSIAAAHATLALSAPMARTGRREQALARADEAVRLYSAALGAEHFAVADALTQVGAVQLALGRAALAEPPLRRAVDVYRLRPAGAERRARAELLLADALWRTPAEHARSRALAQGALALVTGELPSGRRLRGEIEVWLASHP